MRYVLKLSQSMSIQDVARHLGISWDVGKDIQKRLLRRRFRPCICEMSVFDHRNIGIP